MAYPQRPWAKYASREIQPNHESEDRSETKVALSAARPTLPQLEDVSGPFDNFNKLMEHTDHQLVAARSGLLITGAIAGVAICVASSLLLLAV
jgi:hypothetical protein